MGDDPKENSNDKWRWIDNPNVEIQITSGKLTGCRRKTWFLGCPSNILKSAVCLAASKLLLTPQTAKPTNCCVSCYENLRRFAWSWTELRIIFLAGNNISLR